MSQIEQITNFAAGVDRLAAFTDTITPDTEVAAQIQSEEASQLALENVTLLTPNAQRTLVEHLSVHLPQSMLTYCRPQRWGKSSSCGPSPALWQRGTGTIRRPALEAMFFLPQRPYMILDAARATAVPGAASSRQRGGIAAGSGTGASRGTPERVGGLDVELDWADVLSLENNSA